MNLAFHLNNSGLPTLAIALHMAFNHIKFFDGHPQLSRKYGKHLAFFPFFLAGNHLDDIVFFQMKLIRSLLH